MNNSHLILGVTSPSRLTVGNLGKIQHQQVSFADQQATIVVVFRPDILLYLSQVTINSTTSNLKRFRLELLTGENLVQYTIESSSMSVNLQSLPSTVLAGIRLTFLRTTDGQPARDILLSVQACVEEIVTSTTTIPSTTTLAPATSTSSPRTTPITPGIVSQ